MKTYRALGIGNAVVDVIAQTEDNFLAEMGIDKGIMQLVDQERSDLLSSKMGAATTTPGGSVANTISGRGEVIDEHGRRVLLVIERQAHPQPELRVVLEQGVRPRRPAAIRRLRPWGGGQVAAVDAGAAGGVGDHHPIAEHLGDQLDVRRLAAAGAGSGELEQWLGGLRALDGV